MSDARGARTRALTDCDAMRRRAVMRAPPLGT